MKRIIPLALSLVVIIGSAPAYAQAASQRNQGKKVQTVKLHVVDNAYVVTPSTVTKGVPVRLQADPETVKGCAGTVVISAFGVKKTVTKEDAVIEFTPTKTGTIQIACSMGMVKGALTVTAQ
jgi:plastocyanin domain-containing protein